jgi:hypothetical protein
MGIGGSIAISQFNACRPLKTQQQFSVFEIFDPRRVGHGSLGCRRAASVQTSRPPEPVPPGRGTIRRFGGRSSDPTGVAALRA